MNVGVVCGVRCAVYGVRCVGVWGAVCGVWCVVCGCVGVGVCMRVWARAGVCVGSCFCLLFFFFQFWIFLGNFRFSLYFLSFSSYFLGF